MGPVSSTAISILERIIFRACEDCVCGVSASDAIDIAARTSGGKFVDVCVISSSRLVARNSIWVNSIFALRGQRLGERHECVRHSALLLWKQNWQRFLGSEHAARIVAAFGDDLHLGIGAELLLNVLGEGFAAGAARGPLRHGWAG